MNKKDLAYFVGMIRVICTGLIAGTGTKVLFFVIAPDAGFWENWVGDGVEVAAALAAIIAIIWVELARAFRIDKEEKHGKLYNTNFVEALEKRVADYISGNIDFKEAEDIYRKSLHLRMNRIRENQSDKARNQSS